MRFRIAFVTSLMVVTPLIAQIEERARPPVYEPNPATDSPVLQEPAEAPDASRKLRLITDSQSLNYIAKFDGIGTGTVSNSVLFENNGNVGINTTDPKARFHVYSEATQDASIAFGFDPTGATGPALNIGYGGGSFLRGAGFLNARPDASAAAPNPSLRFLTGNTQRMIITNTGAVGIGTTTTAGRLSVLSDADKRLALWLHQRSNVTSGAAPVNDTGLVAEAVQTISAGVTNSGGLVGSQIQSFNLGPGTVTWASGGVFQTGNYPGTQGNVINAYGIQSHIKTGTGTVTNGHGVYIGDIEATNDYGIYQLAANDTNFFAGNMIVGTLPATAGVYALQVNGHAHFNGTVTGTNIKAHYQDVAEWVPATTDLTPGTVVILNRGRSNEVMASATAYDTTVAGVVSAQPGISLGEEGEGKEQIATTGRVKVRVDARSQPILVGDLLVTSDTPGTAMRSQPVNFAGRPFHQPGTILGKALEPLESGIGEILVLLSMQ